MSISSRNVILAIVGLTAAAAFFDARYFSSVGQWPAFIEGPNGTRGGISTNAPPTAQISRSLSMNTEGMKSINSFNPFGSTRIVGSDSKILQVRYSVRIYGDNRTEAMKFMKSVSVNAVRNGSSIKIDRTMSKAPRSIKGVYIDVILQAPKDLNLLVSNKYGELNIRQMEGQVDVDNSFGRTIVWNIGNDCDIDAKYGDIDVSGIDGNLELAGAYGKVAIANVKGSVDLQARYGQATASDITGQLDCRSEYGELRAVRIGESLVATSKYSPVIADEVEGDIRVDSRYGNVDLKNVTEGIDVTSTASRINIGLVAKSDGYNLDVTANKGGSIRESFTDKDNYRETEKSQQGSQKKLRATIGRGKHKVVVKANMADVIFDSLI